MRKIICLILAFFLLIQPLVIPASILAQTQADSITQRHLEGGPTSSAVAFTSSSEGRMDSSRGFIPRDSFQVEKSAQGKVKGLTSSSVLSYDSSGNLINDGSRVITWDVEGKPVKVTTDNLEVLFIYDSNGGRIAKIVKDKSTGNLNSATLYLGGNLEKEINYLPAVSASVATSAKEAASAKEGQQLTANSQPLITTTRYYFANGKRIAQRRTKPATTPGVAGGLPGGGTEELLFIHSDHLSSSTFFTDSQGNKKDSLITYHPYGEQRLNWDIPSSILNLPSSHLYTDQIKDPETDLYYYNARYYDPRIGLFISADTAGDKLNKYAYVSNNPIMANDPSGHMEYDLGGGGKPKNPVPGISIALGVMAAHWAVQNLYPISELYTIGQYIYEYETRIDMLRKKTWGVPVPTDPTELAEYEAANRELMIAFVTGSLAMDPHASAAMNNAIGYGLLKGGPFLEKAGAFFGRFFRRSHISQMEWISSDEAVNLTADHAFQINGINRDATRLRDIAALDEAIQSGAKPIAILQRDPKFIDPKTGEAGGTAFAIQYQLPGRVGRYRYAWQIVQAEKGYPGTTMLSNTPPNSFRPDQNPIVILPDDPRYSILSSFASRVVSAMNQKGVNLPQILERARIAGNR